MCLYMSAHGQHGLVQLLFPRVWTLTLSKLIWDVDREHVKMCLPVKCPYGVQHVLNPIPPLHALLSLLYDRRQVLYMCWEKSRIHVYQSILG